MYFLRKFKDNQNARSNAERGYALKYISSDANGKINWDVENDYTRCPFTIKLLQTGIIYANLPGAFTLKYRIKSNDAPDWSNAPSFVFTNASAIETISIGPFGAGTEVEFMSLNSNGLTKTIGTHTFWTCFYSDVLWEAYGCITSLIFAANFRHSENYPININECFMRLFNRYSYINGRSVSLANNELNSKIYDARNLILPSRIGGDNQFYGMFSNCSDLKYAPKQITIDYMGGAGVTPDIACTNMFLSCTNLTDGPTIDIRIPQFKLATTSLINILGEGMFDKCTSLQTLTLKHYDAQLEYQIFGKFPPTNFTLTCYKSSLGLKNGITVAALNYIEPPTIYLDYLGIWHSRLSSYTDDDILAEINACKNIVDNNGEVHLPASKYVYFGLILYNNRIYYGWARNKDWDTDADTCTLELTKPTYFVLTTQKRFYNQSLTDDISKRCRPVSYMLAGDIGYEGGRHGEIFLDIHNNQFAGETRANVLFHWNGVVPDDVAGVPEIWLSHYFGGETARNNCHITASLHYVFIGMLNNYYLWEAKPTQTSLKAGPSKWNALGKNYILTRGTNFSGCDFDYSDTPIGITKTGLLYAFLNIDMKDGYNISSIGNENYYIIRWNGISIEDMYSTSNIVMEI